MKKQLAKHKKLWITLVFVSLAVAVGFIWADISGQANVLAQDSGSGSAELEKISVALVKKPKSAPKFNQAMEEELKQKIEANEAAYASAAAKAKNEMYSDEKVSDATRTEVLTLAAEYKDLSDKMAALWDEANLGSRSKLVRQAGSTRVKSAEVLAGQIDEKNLQAMDAEQEKLKSARREYVAEATARNEISEEDKADIRKNIVPSANQLVARINGFVQNVTALLAALLESGEAAGGERVGCAVHAAEIRAASETPVFVHSVKVLLAVGKSMLANARALTTDAQQLGSGRQRSWGGWQWPTTQIELEPFRDSGGHGAMPEGGFQEHGVMPEGGFREHSGMAPRR